MTTHDENLSRVSQGRIDESRLSRIGVTVTTIVTAICMVVVSGAIVLLAANSFDVAAADPLPAGWTLPVGPSFDPEVVGVGRAVFVGGMAVLAASGLLGLLARRWRHGPLLPVVHILITLPVAAAAFVGAALLQAFFLFLAYPFPAFAIVVAVVWSTTLYPVRDAAPEQLPYVRYRMRRRVDIAVACAAGVQLLGPLLVMVILDIIGG